MLNVRFHPEPEPQPQAGGRCRFNVLLTEDRPHSQEHWTRQLPRLLQPQGVTAHVARTGREAVQMAERVQFHAAVIDLATPFDPSEPAPSSDPTTMWLLELFRRIPSRPPTVVIHGGFHSQTQVARLLHKALRLGAFSVLGKPVELEQLLRVFQALLERQYAGEWPSDQSQQPDEKSNPGHGARPH